MTAFSPAQVHGECDARPAALIVHNPVAAGAFRAFDDIKDDSLETDLLFRHRPDAGRYSADHDAFLRAASGHIRRVLLLADVLGDDSSAANLASLPNQVFTRDSVVTLPWLPDGFFRTRLKPPQRRIESETMRAALERLGLREIVRLPDDIHLEGGDVIPFAREGRRCLLVGYGPRSTREAIEILQSALLPDFADEIIAIRLAAWRMNLDGGFVPATPDVVVSDRASVLSAELVDAHSRTGIDIWAMLADLGMAVVETTPDESIYAQACNCLCLGDREIIYYDLCPRVAVLLERLGIRVHLIPGAELVKGRGGPRCMSRPIYQPLA